MPKPFIPMTRNDFLQAVTDYNWARPKTEVHVHHTWRPNHSQYSGLRTIEGMWRYHTQTNGWSDIAQHVSIAPDGTIWSGRNWNATPVSAVGYNHRGVFMFETIGDFDTGKDVLKGEQLDSVLTVTAILQIYFGMPLWWSIRFHNQMSGKTCPGSSINRGDFIRAVGEKRDELEPGLTGLASRTLSASQPAAEVIAAFSASDAGALDADPDAEPTHDEALEKFFERDQGAELATASTAPVATVRTGIVAEVAKMADDETAFDLDDLYVELAQRANALGGEESAGTISAGTLSLRSHLSALGKRIFERIQRELHALLCGSNAEDKSERQELQTAFGLGSDAVTAALVAAMTSGLGIAPAIAAVVAAIIVRRVLAPTYLETCAYWGETLDARPG